MNHHRPGDTTRGYKVLSQILGAASRSGVVENDIGPRSAERNQ
jgi:hypothetical protein